MNAREKLSLLKEKFGPAIRRADLPADNRLFVYIEPSSVKAICRHVFRDLDARFAYDGPLILLTSKLSASATEIVAQALQDYGQALIVGDERTFGKGSMQYQTVTDDGADNYFKVINASSPKNCWLFCKPRAVFGRYPGKSGQEWSKTVCDPWGRNGYFCIPTT